MSDLAFFALFEVVGFGVVDFYIPSLIGRD